jgi:hypothetical protein
MIQETAATTQAPSAFPPFDFEMAYSIRYDRLNENPPNRVGKSFGDHVCVQYRTESETVQDFETRYTVAVHIREAWQYFPDGVDVEIHPPI